MAGSVGRQGYEKMAYHVFSQGRDPPVFSPIPSSGCRSYGYLNNGPGPGGSYFSYSVCCLVLLLSFWYPRH